jgi:hypothetical protein
LKKDFPVVEMEVNSRGSQQTPPAVCDIRLDLDISYMSALAAGASSDFTILKQYYLFLMGMRDKVYGRDQSIIAPIKTV